MQNKRPIVAELPNATIFQSGADSMDPEKNKRAPSVSKLQKRRSVCAKRFNLPDL
jgi:hypothetical protein